MKFTRIIICALFTISFAFAAHVCEDNGILSADIGATNSRYVFLPIAPPDTLEELQNFSRCIKSCESVRPLCTENVMRALPPDSTPCCVSLGLPCPCEDNQATSDGLKDLEQQLHDRYGNCRMVLCNDAVNWMKGALAFENQYQKKVDRRPTLLVVLGTAVGLAYFDGDTVKPLELADFAIPYNATRKLLKFEEGPAIGKYVQYLMVGRYFWEEVNRNPLYDAITQFKGERDITVQYRALIDAFVQDLAESLGDSMLIERVIVAGGNARFLDEGLMNIKHDTIALNAEALHGMSSEIIPMLSVYFEK